MFLKESYKRKNVKAILTLINEVVLVCVGFCGDGDVVLVKLTGPLVILEFFLSLNL